MFETPTIRESASQEASLPTSKVDLFVQARATVISTDSTLREIANTLAVLQERFSASQREIATELGKSRAWVCRMLKWRREGFTEDTPFGAAVKVARERAKAVTSKAMGPKAETTPLGAMPLEQGRSGGRQLKMQKLPAEISKLRKRSHALLRVVLDSLAGYPVKINAASKAGIHRKTIEYWLKCSAAGRDGYDVEWRGETAKFHEHHESAMCEGFENIKGAAIQRALGYDEVLTYQGRVSYKFDELLLGLGFEGAAAYLRDENGNPVPETVRKQDPKMMRFLLKKLRPEVWGEPQKKDVTQNGGVLVVGVSCNSEELDKRNAASEFKAQPVTIVEAEGNRTERVAAPDPLLPQSSDSEPHRGAKEKTRPGVTDDVLSQNSTSTPPASHARQQFTAGDGRMRRGYGEPDPGGFRMQPPPSRSLRFRRR